MPTKTKLSTFLNKSFKFYGCNEKNFTFRLNNKTYEAVEKWNGGNCYSLSYIKIIDDNLFNDEPITVVAKPSIICNGIDFVNKNDNKIMLTIGDYKINDSKSKFYFIKGNL